MLLFPSLGDLPNPGIKPKSPASTGRFYTTEPPGKSQVLDRRHNKNQLEMFLSQEKKEKNGKKEREEEGRGRKKTLNILSLNS